MKPKPNNSRIGRIRKIQCRGLPDMTDLLLHECQIGLSRRCPIGDSLLVNPFIVPSTRYQVRPTRSHRIMELSVSQDQ